MTGELMLGWPANPDTGAYVQLGIRYESEPATATLTFHVTPDLELPADIQAHVMQVD